MKTHDGTWMRATFAGHELDWEPIHEPPRADAPRRTATATIHFDTVWIAPDFWESLTPKEPPEGVLRVDDEELPMRFDGVRDDGTIGCLVWPDDLARFDAALRMPIERWEGEGGR